MVARATDMCAAAKQLTITTQLCSSDLSTCMRCWQSEPGASQHAVSIEHLVRHAQGSARHINAKASCLTVLYCYCH